MRAKILLLFSLAALLTIGCKNSNNNSNVEGEALKNMEESKELPLAFDPATLPEEPIFDIETSEGTIRIKLYKETPGHRDNFVKLASERFYDGILFHRVINGFMIQAGDPNTKDASLAAQFGKGGPGYTIPAEINDSLSHKKGALAAARLSDTSNPERASSGSQFYLVQDPENCSRLDGAYTVYGETLEGLDIIDKIAATPTEKDRPITPIKIISVLPVTE